MRGKAAFSKINSGDDHRIDFEWLQSQFKGLYSAYSQDRASYIECVAMLFYDGISTIAELISITEDMIDFNKGTISFPKRTVHISPRTHMLMVYVHSLTEMPTNRVVFALEPYHGSYIPFSIRRDNISQFQNMDAGFVATKISNLLVTNLKDKTGSPINYQAIYALGGYDFLVKKFGKEKIDQFIYDATKSDLDVDLVAATCEEHGIPPRTFSAFKRRMYQFATPPSENR